MRFVSMERGEGAERGGSRLTQGLGGDESPADPRDDVRALTGMGAERGTPPPRADPRDDARALTGMGATRSTPPPTSSPSPPPILVQTVMMHAPPKAVQVTYPTTPQEARTLLETLGAEARSLELLKLAPAPLNTRFADAWVAGLYLARAQETSAAEGRDAPRFASDLTDDVIRSAIRHTAEKKEYRTTDIANVFKAYNNHPFVGGGWSAIATDRRAFANHVASQLGIAINQLPKETQMQAIRFWVKRIPESVRNAFEGPIGAPSVLTAPKPWEEYSRTIEVLSGHADINLHSTSGSGRTTPPSKAELKPRQAVVAAAAAV